MLPEEENEPPLAMVEAHSAARLSFVPEAKAIATYRERRWSELTTFVRMKEASPNENKELFWNCSTRKGKKMRKINRQLRGAAKIVASQNLPTPARVAKVIELKMRMVST